MKSVEDEKAKEIERLSQETEILELDQVITEGVDAKIPFTFIYPNTTKKVGVLVRPLSTNEYQKAIDIIKYNRISGVELVEGSETQQQIFDELMGF